MKVRRSGPSVPIVAAAAGLAAMLALMSWPTTAAQAQQFAQLKSILSAKTTWRQVSCRSHPPTNCTLKPIRKMKDPGHTKPIRQAKKPASPDIPLWTKCQYLQAEDRDFEVIEPACKKAGYPTPLWNPCRSGVVGDKCSDEAAKSPPPTDSPSVGEKIGDAFGDLIKSEYDKHHGKSPPPDCTNSGELQQDVNEILQGCQ